jgi:hypothetical protein
MPKNRPFRVIALFTSSAVLAFGCFDFGGLEQSGAADGGDDASDASSVDANTDNDSSTVNDSGTPAEAGCLVAPTVDASDTAFCNAFAAAGSACGACEACRQTDVNDCASIAAATSTGFMDAFLACQDSGTNCTGYPFVDPATACEIQHLSAAAPNLAQTEVKNAYCSHCPDAGGNGIPCSSFYYYPDGGPTLASGLMLASDNILSMVTANCTTFCGGVAFAVCASQQFCDVAPHSACATGICK